MTILSQNNVTSNQIQVFNFAQAEVLTSTDENGEPLFCLTDVAKVLDIQNLKPSRFNFKEAGIHKMNISFPSGKKETIFIDVRNLYRMIFRKKNPEALKFQDWVYDEVIPAIRKNGSYTKEVDIIPLTLLAQWADLLLGRKPTDTLFDIKDRYQVKVLTELQESQINNEIQKLLEQVGQYTNQNKKPQIELKQVNCIVGPLNAPHELRLSLHAIVKLVAKCCLDNATAYRTITARLEHACKLANLDWITHDRLSTALRELADITDDIVKHRDTLQEIDKNAIVRLRVVDNNEIGYMV